MMEGKTVADSLKDLGLHGANPSGESFTTTRGKQNSLTGIESSPEACPPSARIFLVDDQPMLREGLRHFLNRQADLKVTHEFGDLVSALDGLHGDQPDLLVLELRLRGADVLEFIKAVRARWANVRVLVYSLHEDVLYAERALRAGAQGYLMKQEACEEVLHAIRKVLRGEMYVSRQIAAGLLSKLLQAPAAPGPRPIDGLSDREFQVFHMLGAGLGNRHIAAQLKLSVKTIETYRENIKHKFGFKTSPEMVRHATQWLLNGGAGRLDLKPDALPSVIRAPAAATFPVHAASFSALPAAP